MVERYYEAEMAVLDGKAVQFGGRTLTMESLKEIRAGREYWEKRLSAEQAQAKGLNLHYSLAEFK